MISGGYSSISVPKAAFSIVLSSDDAEFGFQGMGFVRPATTTNQGYEFSAQMDTLPGTGCCLGTLPVCHETGFFLDIPIARRARQDDTVFLNYVYTTSCASIYPFPIVFSA